MTQFKKLFEPGRIGILSIKNRIVMAPMQTFSYEPEGTPNQKTIEYFVARAAGGVGLIICPGGRAVPETRVPGTPNFYDDAFIPPFKKLADAIHGAGTKVAFQINHTGKALSYTNKEFEAVGPSPLRYVKTGVLLKELTGKELSRLIEEMSEAARRIRDAGFDLVEFHAAHGYLLGSFLSPYTNRRTDEYGGTPEKRARFLSEIIQRTREKVGPDFPISVRLSGSEFLRGGTTLEDTIVQAPLLVRAGATVLHVSGGAHENTEFQFLSYLWPDAFLTPLAARLKQVLDVPIITVGKLGHPEVAEKVLEEKRADFIALGRPLLADPEWPNKIRDQRAEEIHLCIGCNNCWDRMFTKSRQYGRLFCTINPSLLREREFKLKPAPVRKRVMVVGGGLAGMEAARTARLRGHEVALYEKAEALGGQWTIAAAQPGKEIYRNLLCRLEQGISETGVKLHLNQEVSPDLARELAPDVLVLATGAFPQTLAVPGIKGSNVFQAVDVVQGKAQLGEKIVVIGGRLVGMEIALYLAEQGKSVSLVTAGRLGENGKKLEENLYRTLRNRLVERGIHLYPCCPLLEVREDGIFVDDGGNLMFLEAETIILATGSLPRNEMVDELKSIVPEFYLIGDCKEPRDGLEAIHEGAEVGRII
jgi:2,4-dienoyl-CoA reductase-like NADH-dependent reductase (Old Yellow Enzyme family)/thioredoxin reductase